jgi:hypothetical protein
MSRRHIGEENAMKPEKRVKLSLNRESLRKITTPDLEKVAGGFSGPPTFICESGCIGRTCVRCT